MVHVQSRVRPAGRLTKRPLCQAWEGLTRRGVRAFAMILSGVFVHVLAKDNVLA